MRICPECQTHYPDDVETCRTDGEALVDLPDELSGNPADRQVKQAQPNERTSMIDLEAIEAKRAARRAERDAEQGEDGELADEKTPPPEEPAEDDVDATGTLQRSRLRKRRGSTRINPGDADIPADRRVGEDATNRDLTRRTRAGTRAGQTGLGNRTTRNDGTRADRTAAATGLTRRTQMGAPETKPVSAAAATFAALLFVGALVGGIIAVSRLFAVLTVTTVPPGAEVRLDGEVVGTAPLQKRIRTGSHVIELSLAEYEPFKEVVDVPTGGLPFLQPLQKKPPPPLPPPTAAQLADELLRHAQQLFEANDLEGAKNKLEEAKRLVGDHAGVNALLTKVDAEIEARAAAFKQAQSQAAMQERLRQARVFTEDGKRFYEKNQLTQAKEKLYQALKLDPGYPEPHRTLGKIYNREDDVDKVRYHLERYLQLGGADGDFKVREWLKSHPR